jgi:paraquat-inducible protein B
MSEIFLAPSVVMPIVAGASAWILSWAAGGVGMLNLVGLVGFLGGIGWMATRAIFLTDKITESTLRELKQKQKDEENRELDNLQRKLRKDGDHRTQDYLLLLRSLKDDFEEVTGQPGVEKRSAEVVQQVRQLFAAAIVQLERTYKYWQLSERLIGDERDQIIDQREKLIDEIKATVDHLKNVTKQYSELMTREQQVDLSQLRDELDTSLRIAKRTEERMREIESKPDYESFLKE